MSQGEHEVGVHLESLNPPCTTQTYPTYSAQMRSKLMVGFCTVIILLIFLLPGLRVRASPAVARPNHLAQPLIAGIPKQHQVLPLACMRESDLHSWSRINYSPIIYQFQNSFPCVDTVFWDTVCFYSRIMPAFPEQNNYYE